MTTAKKLSALLIFGGCMSCLASLVGMTAALISDGMGGGLVLLGVPSIVAGLLGWLGADL